MNDCILYGKHNITTKEGLTLKQCLNKLSKTIKVPISKISKVSYFNDDLDINKKIRELNLPSRAVLSVKFKKD